MTRIAFTSCIDATDDKKQPVWSRINKQKPDALLLLGDTIYMDFGLAMFLDSPRNWTHAKFAATMYDRYKTQWEVEDFRKFLERVPLVGAIWDDHDFAWNNSCGAGAGGKDTVPAQKRRIARGLFLQFRQHVQTRPVAKNYPPMPPLNDLLNSGDAGIQEAFDCGPFRCIMTDGRTFRETPADDRSTTLLGDEQLAWLFGQIQTAPGIALICSGSAMTRAEESWDHYRDLTELLKRPYHAAIALSGDIHENAFRRHPWGPKELCEATSSGAARPGLGGDCGNFGIIEAKDATRATVSLFDRHDPAIVRTIDLGKELGPDDPVPWS